MTGIDRVELAYLTKLSATSDPLFAIARTGPGYVLLDATGARATAQALSWRDVPPLDVLGHISPFRPEPIRRAEALLRRLSIARCLPPLLGPMMQRHLPHKLRYLNVGHSNLTPRMLAALDQMNAQVTVLVHDAIPLVAPAWHPEKAVTRARVFLKRVEENADLVIHSTNATREVTESHMSTPPPGVTAALGVTSAQPEPLPSGLEPINPYFLSVGTLDARKNHALLLDLWENKGQPMPQLILAGSRGWHDGTLFDRLDRGIPGVTEAPGLSDGQISTLLNSCAGLLFPSHLEGYGLPPMEAASRGVPVLAQPLAALCEVIGDVPTYLPGDDIGAWRDAIEALMTRGNTPKPFIPPTWDEHFNSVLRLT